MSWSEGVPALVEGKMPSFPGRMHSLPAVTLAAEVTEETSGLPHSLHLSQNVRP